MGTRAGRLLPLLLVGACGGAGSGLPPGGEAGSAVPGAARVVRVAAYNVEELTVVKVDSVDGRGRGLHPQLRAAAAVIEAVRPDILVLNEVDLARSSGGSVDTEDPGAVARRFVAAYLGEEGPDYPHLFAAPTNTGVVSGRDLNADGTVADRGARGTTEYGEDSWGFGLYPGHFGMAVLSRYPLVADEARTFRDFRWTDLPGHHMPVEFYGPAASEVRLSSKSHWDVPVEVHGTRLHLLVSHPTPPVFDGAENRNGRRNFDEIGFWARYLDGSDALYDDRGRRGGYGSDAPYVLLGDLNAAPAGGEARLGDIAAISQLLDHPRLRDPEVLRGRPTAEFLGGTRVDYVLVAPSLDVVDGGVFWPDPEADPAGAAAADDASDHRLVWLDLRLPDDATSRARARDATVEGRDEPSRAPGGPSGGAAALPDGRAKGEWP